MPELPEVECLVQALSGPLQGSYIKKASFLRKDLREPIPAQRFRKIIVGQEIQAVSRRSKYILIHTSYGRGIIHLGMSGHLLIYEDSQPQHKHTHAIFEVHGRDGQQIYLHYVDPRRFGFIQCCTHEEYSQHRFFQHLGPEPLESKDLGGYLYERSRTTKRSLKSYLMDASVVVGVGNIYANEALFRSGLAPQRPAVEVTRKGYQSLGLHIQETLRDAIRCGGTTLRDYKNLRGKPGYFQVELQVYAKAGKECPRCGEAIQSCQLHNRATYYCLKCQS